MITLQFVDGQDLSSQIIEWFSAGPKYSHVDVAADDGSLLGARLDGVKVRNADYIGSSPTLRVEIPATDAQTAACWRFLYQQVGKPYDKAAILGFVAGRNWRDPAAWFCSELGAAALEQAGIILPLASPANRITPAGLLLVCSALVPVHLPIQ